MGLKGIHSPRGPKMVGWPVILPLVQKGEAEQRHGGKSLTYHTLLPGPDMCLVLGLLCHKCGHS